MIKKIFTILITVVVFLVISAFILNTALPNALSGVTNAIENGIKAGTGIEIDFNGDGVGKTTATGAKQDKVVTDGAGVGGFDGFTGG